jgi:ATPase subunit of ABC transporter with duplicated ATPase domains
MISTDRLSLAFAGHSLFEDVSIKFVPGNCYGLIGANGAGKSTFLRCLSGEQEPTAGTVIIPPHQRLSMLRQDHFAYDDVEARTAVIMGHAKLFQVMAEKDALYAKVDFSDADGLRAAELETEFADLDGWNAEANASALLTELGVKEPRHGKLVKELEDGEKVRVLLAQALFGEPEILLLDEPTNHLDVDTILWLEDFLMSFKHTVIVVSHDRHFLDRVCTHVADVDFQKVTLFTGNYSFWYQSSQLALRLRQESNRRKEDQIKDLKAFVQRFSANASKSRQATSRKVQLDKITLDDIRPSSRRYPFIAFETERELGKDVLVVDGISKTLDGEVLFRNLSFMLTKGEKMALTGNDLATTTLLQVLAGEVAPDTGQVRWGRTANLGYFPKDNAGFFDTDLNIIEWLRRVSANQEETYVRAFLGRMLFSGEASKKSAQVLSGGEKVRCMISRLMLQDPNVLLLDGPTNHLDLESITAFNNGLLKFTGSLVLSSHDVQFVDSLVTRVIELAGEKHYDLDMTYEEYLADPARYARGGTLEGRAA